MSTNRGNVLLGVSGSVAAFKAAALASLLVREGFTCTVTMTQSARHFVGPETFRDLTNRPVAATLWSGSSEYRDHVDLAEWADVVVLAPATANLLAKLSAGLADDIVTAVLLATTAPTVVAPAMESNMWNHPATRANVELLRQRGVSFVGPVLGRLASGSSGAGRMSEPTDILDAIKLAMRASLSRRDLQGLSILVTAGPTREPIDPVRFISNESSGKMGYALARAARDRGAEVTLVSGPVDSSLIETLPPKVKLIPVETAQELTDATIDAAPSQDVIVMAAAVADFRPSSVTNHKIKKGSGFDNLALELVPDILSLLRTRASQSVRVGFAAETDDLIANARAKLEEKGLSMIVANDVGDRQRPVFGSDDNEVTILTANAEPQHLARASKLSIANSILDRVKDLALSCKT